MTKTIIEELVVELGLDDSKLAGQAREVDRRYGATKERLRKGGNEIEAGVKRQGAAFGSLRRELVGLLALFTAGAGLKQFINNTVRSDAAVGRLSKQIGVSTEELSAWQGVLRRNGGSAEGATAALGTMTNAYEEFIATGRTSLPYLQQLGAMGFRLDHLKNPTEALLKLSDIFSKVDPKKAAFWGRQFGFDEATIALLIKGRSAVEAQLKEQRQISVVTEANAKEAQRLQNVFSSLIQRSADLGRQLMLALAPAIEKVTEWLTRAADWAQKNRPVVMGFFLGIVAALGALAVAAAIAVAPTILLVAAIAALGAGFAKLVQDNPELQESLGDLAASLKELWDSMVSFAQYVAESPFGKWIADAFRPAGPVVKGLALTIATLAAAIRAVAAALRGDWGAAWAALKDVGTAMTTPIVAGAPPAARQGAQGQQARNGTGVGNAVRLIKGFEGYRQNAYWDVNAHRAGYGSDTVTDPTTGKVTKVNSKTKVTRAQADADLQRRIEKEFLPKVMKDVGGARWASLDADTQAALLSVAYNYGSLPSSVTQAAKSGDRGQIASAVSGLQSHNRGVNAGRRRAEANLIAGGTAANQNTQLAALPPGVRGLSPSAGTVSNSYNKTEVRIDRIEVNTQATDANGVARDLGPAIQRRMYVTQANRGLG